MAWVRIDDSFPDHPKAVQAGPMACWLYVCSIAYANRYLTDGFIPERQIWRLIDSDDAEALADALIDAGLWEQAENGYQIHDYLDYQPSAERVKADRVTNAQRQAKWRERNTGSNAVTNATVTPAPSNNPSTRTNTTQKTKTNTGSIPEGEQEIGAKTRKPLPANGPAQVLVKTWAERSGVEPGNYGKAAGQAAQLVKAGVEPGELLEMFDWFAASQFWQEAGFDLGTCVSQVEKFRQAKRTPKTTTNGRASPQVTNAELSKAAIRKAANREPEFAGPVFETTGRISS